MAITTGISSSPNQPPPLPTLSLPTLPPLIKTNLPFPSTTIFGANLVSNDALLNGAAAEAVAEVARDAAVVGGGVSEVWSCNESGSYESGLMVRRKNRRRRRRRGLECFDDEERKKREPEDDRVSFGVVRDGYLSPREEALCCQSLKEGAELESERTRVMEAQEHEPTSTAMRMKMSNIDKIICNRKVSQEKLIKSYMGLVVSVASIYQGKGLSLQDLIQEGSIGLLRGAEKFDPERGLKLSTYVYWWIRQAIIRAIEKKSRIIRLPGHICGVMAKITKAKISFNQRFQRLPSHDEIAEMINVQASTVRLVCERGRLPLSLDRVVTDQGCMALQDIIRGPDEMMPETMLRKQLLKQEVGKLLRTLSDREAHVLRLHFGLNGETPQSFEEIGRLLKLSRERVRQINSTALSKLKQTCTLDNLKIYIV